MGNQGALPVRLTRFVGRETDMAELVEVLKQVRLLSLVGAPGCGKTRLAVELAEPLAETFPGGVWFVDLASVADPAMVPDAVAAAGGVSEERGRPIDDVLADQLRDADPTLLLFDNCEHVVESAARLAERLVVSCPLVQVVGTSRVPLLVQGEQVWRVHPLDAMSAATLFVDRARLASSDFSAGGDEPVVGEICRWLDGLPLAIELTASWTRVLSLAEIAERLGQSLPLPGAPWRDIDPRHRTMEATVAWSTRLLGLEDRRLFAQLAVFVGGFDLDAAVAVGGPGSTGEVLGGLTRLVDDSLVLATPTAKGAMHFRLLEPIRQCALAMLESAGEADEVERRHAEHFLTLARAGEPFWYRDARPMPGFAYFQEYAENFHAAFAWARQQPGDLGLQFCEALAPFWEFVGRVNDGRRWLEQYIEAGSPDDQLCVSTRVWASRMAYRQGDYRSASRWLDLCDPYLSGLTPWWHALVALHHGMAAMADGKLAAAAERCEHALELSRAAGDTTGAGRAQCVLGYAALLAGDVAEATRLNTEADAMAESVGNMSLAAHTRMALCHCAFFTGDPVQQRSCTLAALAAVDAGGFLEELDTLGLCALLAVAEGRLEAAGRLHGATIARGERRSNHPARAGRDAVMTLVERMVGPTDPAVEERLIAEGARLSMEGLRAEALAEPERHPVLSRREREVADLVAEGLNNREIAERLFISRRTVETHVENIRRKLGLASRYEIRRPNP